jgi:arylsulfatase A-like enzyme
MHNRSNVNSHGSLTTRQRSHFIGLYERSLAYLDGQIGRLLTRVEELGLADNTIIIAVADHGEEFLDHGRWGHWEGNLHDEVLKVPLLIRVPNERPGQVIRQQVRLLDLMPTILDLCGCPIPSALMGVSLAPIWTKREAGYQEEAAISEMRRDPRHRVAVRTGAFKYIWDSQRPEHPVLYDLRTDPGEKQNVSERFPQEVGQFQARVHAHLRRVADTEAVTTAPDLEYDAEVTRRLRDLGYVD